MIQKPPEEQKTGYSTVGVISHWNQFKCSEVVFFFFFFHISILSVYRMCSPFSKCILDVSENAPIKIPKSAFCREFAREQNVLISIPLPHLTIE